MDLVLFLAISFLGYKIFKIGRIPAPAVLGPIFAIGAANFFNLSLVVPFYVKPFFSVILGIILGLRCSFKVKGLWKEIAMIMVWVVIVTGITAIALQFAGLSEANALFSAMPGGTAEVTLVSMSFGADSFEVALLQASRTLVTILIISFMVKKIQGKKEKQPIDKSGATALVAWDWVIMAIAGIVMAILLNLIKVPAPYLFGPLLTTIIYVRTRKLRPPAYPGLQNFAQLGVGGIVGLTVTRESILAFPHFIPAIIVLNLFLVGSSILISLYLHRYRGWDLTTSLLALAPAGLTPLTVMALEMDADVSKVAIVQMVRLVLVILIAPLQGYLYLIM